jgi:hypothetical protein
VLAAPSFLLSVRLQAAEAVLTRMHEGRPALSVSPSCTTLIAALDGGYHFRRLKVAGERYAEEPEKDEYSDPADAFMYGLLGGGEGRAVLTGSSRAEENHEHDPRLQSAGAEGRQAGCGGGDRSPVARDVWSSRRDPAWWARLLRPASGTSTRCRGRGSGAVGRVQPVAPARTSGLDCSEEPAPEACGRLLRASDGGAARRLAHRPAGMRRHRPIASAP